MEERFKLLKMTGCRKDFRTESGVGGMKMYTFNHFSKSCIIHIYCQIIFGITLKLNEGCLDGSVKHLTLDFSSDHAFRVVRWSLALGSGLGMEPAFHLLPFPFCVPASKTKQNKAKHHKQSKKANSKLGKYICNSILQIKDNINT